MKVLDYVKSLLPSTEKDSILADIRETRNKLTNFAKPAYESSHTAFSTWKFKSEVMLDHVSMFQKICGTRENIFTAIQRLIPVAIDNLAFMDDLVVRTFNRATLAEGMTYRKVAVLQYLEACSFVASYSVEFMNYAMIMETAAVPEAEMPALEAMAPRQIENVQRRFMYFCQALNAIAHKRNDLAKQLDNVPDICVTEDNAQTIVALNDEVTIDTQMMGFIPVVLNPVYHWKMWRAERMDLAARAAREELKAILLRKQNLIMLSKGKPDAHQQKVISNIDKLVKKMRHEIDVLETKNA